MDDLDYFPAGDWPSGYATRPGQANPGGVRPGEWHHGTEQADGRPRNPTGGWTYDSFDSGSWPPAPPQREAPGTGHLYTGSWPSPGYQPDNGYPPDAYYPSGAYAPVGVGEFPSYDDEPSYDDPRGYYDDPRGGRPSYDRALDSGLPYENDGPADAFAGRATQPNGVRPSRRRALSDTGSSLLADFPPSAAPVRAPRTTDRPAPRASASAAASPAAAPGRSLPGRPVPGRPVPGRPLPDWLPFGSRIVVLPKEAADADDANREHRDVSGGALRPAVFGAMDGLVTNASLIAGIGGGGGGHSMIVLTGVAGLIAGAFSMATGEYISVKSQNELTQSEVELERRQYARDGAGKLDKLVQTYIGKGVSPNLAEAVARQISADPERAVAEHVREELGLDPDDLPSPRTAAIASMVSFTVGALIPLSPFLLGFPSLQAALILSGLSAYAGGAAVARLTGRPVLLGGLRQFAAAFAATGMSFLIGHLISTHVR